MAFVKVPNLCGANALQDELLSKVEDTSVEALNQIDGAIDAEASDMIDSISATLTPLAKSITDMIPALPDTPNIN